MLPPLTEDELFSLRYAAEYKYEYITDWPDWAKLKDRVRQHHPHFYAAVCAHKQAKRRLDIELERLEHADA